MEWNKEVTERVRGAMRDRARVMACLCGELEKILPSDKAEAAARKAITSYGCIRAERDGHKITPDEWVDIHYRDMGGVFETEITKNDEYSEMRMHYCPLLEEWKAMGLSPEKQDLYCDIAMELDRNRAAEHDIPCGSAKATAFAASACGKKPGPRSCFPIRELCLSSEKNELFTTRVYSYGIRPV